MDQDPQVCLPQLLVNYMEEQFPRSAMRRTILGFIMKRVMVNRVYWWDTGLVKQQDLARVVNVTPKSSVVRKVVKYLQAYNYIKKRKVFNKLKRRIGYKYIIVLKKYPEIIIKAIKFYKIWYNKAVKSNNLHYIHRITQYIDSNHPLVLENSYATKMIMTYIIQGYLASNPEARNFARRFEDPLKPFRYTVPYFMNKFDMAHPIALEDPKFWEYWANISYNNQKYDDLEELADRITFLGPDEYYTWPDEGSSRVIYLLKQLINSKNGFVHFLYNRSGM